MKQGGEFSEAWARDYCKRNGFPLPAGVRPEPDSSALAAEKILEGLKGRKQHRNSGSKYGNEKTTMDGITFDSKREADHYKELKLRRAAGEIMGFACQVIFQLPGGVKYIADFVLLLEGGKYIVEDTKGFRTKDYLIKKKLMRNCLGIEITEI